MLGDKFEYRIKWIHGNHRLQVKSQVRDTLWITVKSSRNMKDITKYTHLHGISNVYHEVRD